MLSLQSAIECLLAPRVVVAPADVDVEQPMMDDDNGDDE
jgi:hypothetical protein